VHVEGESVSCSCAPLAVVLLEVPPLPIDHPRPLSPFPPPQTPHNPRYSLEDELRVLVVHGCLHLAGFDHEQGGAQLDDMAAAETEILAKLGWKGQGLIEAANDLAGDDGDEEGSGNDVASSGSSSSSTASRAASGSQASVSTLSGDNIITRTGGCVWLLARVWHDAQAWGFAQPIDSPVCLATTGSQHPSTQHPLPHTRTCAGFAPAPCRWWRWTWTAPCWTPTVAYCPHRPKRYAPPCSEAPG